MSILNYFSREENVPGLPSVESTPELHCKELSAANKRVGEQYLRQEELRRTGSKRPRGEYIDWKESERAEIGRYASEHGVLFRQIKFRPISLNF